MIGDAIAAAFVVAAGFSSGWVVRDAHARGLPRRKALTWAALQWIEFPLFLWLYRRIRPKRKRSGASGPDVDDGVHRHRMAGAEQRVPPG